MPDEADGLIDEIPDSKTLWFLATPQCFHGPQIMNANGKKSIHDRALQ